MEAEKPLINLFPQSDFEKNLFLKNYVKILKMDNKRLRKENRELINEIHNRKMVHISKLKNKLQRQVEELQRKDEIINKLKSAQ